MNGDNLPYQTLDVVPFTPITSEWGDGVGDDILALAGGTGFDAGAIPTAAYADGSVTSLKLTEAFVRGRLKAAATSSAPTGLTLQYGWGYLEGNGDATVVGSETFPTAFASAPVVWLTPLGADTSGAPTAITEFTTLVNTVVSAQAAVISTTGFNIRINRASGTYNSGNYFGYSWIALGAV